MLRPCFSVNTGEMFTLQQTLSHAVSDMIFFSPSFLKHPFHFTAKPGVGGYKTIMKHNRDKNLMLPRRCCEFN